MKDQPALTNADLMPPWDVRFFIERNKARRWVGFSVMYWTTSNDWRVWQLLTWG